MFDFLNRRDNRGFDQFIDTSVKDEDYITWNEFALPFDYGDDEFEYSEPRNRCAIFDSMPLQKIRMRGSDCGRLLDSTLTRPPSLRAPHQRKYVAMDRRNVSDKLTGQSGLIPARIDVDSDIVETLRK